MKKKFLITVTAIVCMLACVLSLVACASKDEPSAHTHSYQWADNGDGTHSGHCFVTGCDKPNVKNETHIFGANGKCEKCSAVMLNDGHTHTWSQSYETNATHHWHVCMVSGCSEKNGYAEHNFAVGDCVCGKKKPYDGHTHAWSQSYETNDTHHWQSCTVSGCSEKNGYAEHDYSNGDCVCGKKKPGDEHTHVWSQTWETNDKYHWHNCTTNGCPITDNTQKYGYAEHDITNGDCVCGKESFLPTEGLQYQRNGDSESYSIIGIGNATASKIIIPSEYEGKPVTSIARYAFNGCSSITSITIPRSVANIGDSAFSGCSSLTSISIPFVGGRVETAINSGKQYPFGYIFGTESYEGGTATKQSYYEYYYVLSSGSIVSNTVSTTYYIPSSLKTVTVTGGNILYGAFDGCNGLTSLTIPDMITSIGDNAFRNCSGLTSITIPDRINRITSIGNGAFSGCSSLTSMMIPYGVTSIGYNAFSGCSSITSITISRSVANIGDGAFSGCSSLTSMTIPFVGRIVNNTNDKYQHPFGYIFGTESYEGGTATIQRVYAYGTDNTTFKTYYIPSSLKTVTVTGGNILYGAFGGCNGLTSITIPNSVTSIGQYAFSGCSGLTSITIPYGVTSIGEDAFSRCSGLTGITIQYGVKSIGYKAFSGCSSLTSVTIPDSVTRIGSSAFENCSGLTSVTIKDGITLETGLTSIGENAFRNCSGLTSITIPDSVTSIGKSAFFGCVGLTSVTFNGTKAEWRAVSKGSSWDSVTGNYTVTCTDGKLDKNDKEII